MTRTSSSSKPRKYHSSAGTWSRAKKRKERRDNEFFCTFITWTFMFKFFSVCPKKSVCFESIIWGLCVYVCWIERVCVLVVLQVHKYYSFINDLYLTISINLGLCMYIVHVYVMCTCASLNTIPFTIQYAQILILCSLSFLYICSVNQV